MYSDDRLVIEKTIVKHTSSRLGRLPTDGVLRLSRGRIVVRFPANWMETGETDVPLLSRGRETVVSDTLRTRAAAVRACCTLLGSFGELCAKSRTGHVLYGHIRRRGSVQMSSSHESVYGRPTDILAPLKSTLCGR